MSNRLKRCPHCGSTKFFVKTTAWSEILISEDDTVDFHKEFPEDIEWETLYCESCKRNVSREELK